MAFADLTANLRLNIADFSSKMSEASKTMSRFAGTLQTNYGKANASLKSHNLGLKDTARIVQGILVSQTFYAAAGSIREATQSLWEFNKALDYANVTYSALFGDTKLAGDFMKVLQEHAINTMFDYQDLTDASKKLLAYGIEYENLMFIMEGLTNLGAMSGDSAALDRISLALGQIYTKGKLSAEEMRQLSNAYVPISDIIQEKFNLSPKDMERVGDLNLPAEDVINAIVDYANERFGSVGDAAMYTITGIQAKIVDTLKVVGTEMLASTTTAYKSFLVYLSNGLDAIRNEYATGGIGGVFEFLVPDEHMQTVIRQFVANVKNLFMSLVSVGIVAGQVFGNFAYVLVNAFNIVAPLITGFVNVLAGVLNAMLSTSTGAKVLRIALLAAAGAFVILKVQAIASLVVTAVTKAIVGLSKALLLLATLVVKHPILMLLAGLAIALVGVSVSSNNANKSIMGLFDTLSGAAGGYSQDDVLQRIEKEMNNSADAADQFNNRLGDGKDAAEDLEDGINNAGKAAKKASSLLSFDEVFRLNEPTDAAGSGIGSGITDSIGGLIEGLGTLGDALIPEIPDFSEYINGFTDGLFGGIEDGIMERLKNSALGMLIGGGIGAIIGGIIGGPAGAVLGAKIGAFAGALIGLFSKEIGAFFKTDTGLGSIIGAGLGAIIGGILGGPAGAAIGTAIGALAGGIVGKFKDEIVNFLSENTGAAIGGAIGAVIGAVMGGPVGSYIGANIGYLVGMIFDRFKTEIVSFFKSDTGIATAIGTGLGGLIGFIAGGPIGAGIGAVVGGMISYIASYIREHWADIKENGVNILFGVLEGMRTFAKEKIWEPIKGFFKAIWDGFCYAFGIKSPADEMIPIGKFIIEGVLLGMKQAFVDVLLWVANHGIELIKSFGSWWSGITANTKEALSNLRTEWSTKWGEIKEDYKTWRTNVKNDVNTWFGQFLTDNVNSLIKVKNAWNEKWHEINIRFITWRTNVKNDVISWFGQVLTENANGLIKIKNKWSEKWTEVSNTFATWRSNVKNAMPTWFTQMLTENVNGLIKIKNTWSEKWNEIKTNLGTWWTGMKTSMGTWLETNIWQPISSFFNITTFWNRMSSLLSSIKRKISSWWEGILDSFDAEVDIGGTVKGSSGFTGGGRYTVQLGHADGGIFDREHIARFAEGNKREAIIPLENNSAMQPFVDAVSNGIIGSLAPILAQGGGNANQLPPMYIGTLVADDRGLKELYKKFEIIQVQENARRGTVR